MLITNSVSYAGRALTADDSQCAGLLIGRQGSLCPRRQSVDRPTVIRARLARAIRVGEQPEVIESLRRDYYASRARDYLREWITSDPPPTTDQRRELAALLVSTGSGAGAAA